MHLYDVKNHEHEISLRDVDTKHIDNAVTAISHTPLRCTQTLTCSCTLNNSTNMYFMKLRSVGLDSGGVVKLWDILTGHCMFSIKEKREILGVLHHPVHSRFITYGDDGKIHLYDMETQSLEAIYQSR